MAISVPFSVCISSSGDSADKSFRATKHRASQSGRRFGNSSSTRVLPPPGTLLKYETWKSQPCLDSEDSVIGFVSLDLILSEMLKSIFCAGVVEPECQESTFIAYPLQAIKRVGVDVILSKVLCPSIPIRFLPSQRLSGNWFATGGHILFWSMNRNRKAVIRDRFFSLDSFDACAIAGQLLHIERSFSLLQGTKM